MNKLRKVLGVLLILIGIAVISNVVYKKYVTNEKQDQLLNILEGQMTEGGSLEGEELRAEDIEKMEQIEEAVNGSDNSEGIGNTEGTGNTENGENNVEDSLDNVSLELPGGFKALGIIEIPVIELKQGLVEGVSDEVLQHYIGYFTESARPGQNGNFSVAGHRISDYTDAFVNLHKVQPGDEVIIKIPGKKYTYEIEENFIVDPERSDVLDQTADPTITLITCTVGAKQRVIIKGKLIRSEKL